MVTNVVDHQHRAALTVAAQCPGSPAQRREVLQMLGLVDTPRPARRVGPNQPIRHGTAAGAHLHRKRGGKPCPDCREAERVYCESRRRAAGAPLRGCTPIRHGLPGGYRTHLKRGETPCVECRLAYRRRRKELQLEKVQRVERAAA